MLEFLVPNKKAPSSSAADQDKSQLVIEMTELRARHDALSEQSQRQNEELTLLRKQLIERPGELPPDHLQTRQVGKPWGPNFYIQGRVIFDQIASAFAEVGKPLTQAQRILDFGCGCGRVLWSFQHVPHIGEIWGCDVDAESIAWDRANLGHIAQFSANPALPPTAFPTGYFDAIYNVSVFTHLPEDVQFVWLSEMRRILRPGGIIGCSLHGAHYWKTIEPGVTSEVEARGFAYRTGQPTPGTPDYYMVAFHSAAYVQERWGRYFEFLQIKEKYIHGVHDFVLLRRRDD